MPSATRRSPRRATASRDHVVRSPAAPSCEGIKRTPPSRELRDELRRRAECAVTALDAARPLEKSDFELIAQNVLDELSLPADFLGWTMVVLASAHWREQVMAVPPNRRLLLLPGEAVGAGNCAELNEARTVARQLGYQFLEVEQSAAILSAVMEGEVDAIVGLASLDLLERAVDHVLGFGIPCLALPLLDSGTDGIRANSATGNGSKNGLHGKAFDADWLLEMIELPYRASDQIVPNYVHLLRASNRMFDAEELEALAPRLHPGPALAALNGNAASLLDPICGTETIAYDFLARGGKHSRPFIVLAVYDAMTGGLGARPGAHRRLAALPDAVRRAALSIETFHKASLVHDDIEDDDPFRYGEPTLHRRFGIPVAVNVGDYLIGLGYRLVSREAKALGPEAVSDILDQLAQAHLKLSAGQGAELLWRDSRDRRLSSNDALQIYRLKTAPAFEAALLTGLRLAVPIDGYLEPIRQFAESLGTAFQILNDLGDWQADRQNKLVAAGDVTGGRPTVLWALALEGLRGRRRQRLEQLAAIRPATDEIVAEIAGLYREAGVFDKAGETVRQCESAARKIATAIEPAELRRLLLYLIEWVLKRPSP